MKQVKFPVLLNRSSYSALWYKPDTMFSTPKAYVKIDFNCPYAASSPEAEVMTDIFTRLLMDYLNEYGRLLFHATSAFLWHFLISCYMVVPEIFSLFSQISAYYAQVAGLYYGINHKDNGLQVLCLISFTLHFARLQFTYVLV